MKNRYFYFSLFEIEIVHGGFITCINIFRIRHKSMFRFFYTNYEKKKRVRNLVLFFIKII